MDGRLAFLVVMLVLVLGMVCIPAGIEIALFRFSRWRGRRRLARESDALPTYRHDTGVSAGARLRALSVVSARKRGMEDFNDAA